MVLGLRYEIPDRSPFERFILGNKRECKSFIGRTSISEQETLIIANEQLWDDSQRLIFQKIGPNGEKKPVRQRLLSFKACSLKEGKANTLGWIKVLLNGNKLCGICCRRNSI